MPQYLTSAEILFCLVCQGPHCPELKSPSPGPTHTTSSDSPQDHLDKQINQVTCWVQWCAPVIPGIDPEAGGSQDQDQPVPK